MENTEELVKELVDNLDRMTKLQKDILQALKIVERLSLRNQEIEKLLNEVNG